MNTINFTVHGDPKGQPRPRAFARGGRARVYDPGTAEGWKSQVAIAAKPFIPSSPFVNDISLKITFRFARPKAHYGCKKGVRYLKDNAPVSHVQKPDSDNLAKAVMDALTIIGMWHDDSQINNCTFEKRWCDEGQQGADISIVAL